MLYDRDWQLFVVKYVLLCKLHFFLGMRPSFSERPLLRTVTKCGPIILLITAVTTDLAGKAPRSADVTAELTLLAGLVFSAVGDACLVYPTYFLPGLLSFAVTQGLYSALFGGKPHLLFVDAGRKEVVPAATILTVSLTVYCALVSNMSKLTKPLAFLYCLLISFMLWSAVVKLQGDTNDWTIFGAVGAALFYASDLLLAIDKWGTRLPLGPYLVLGTYYTAQLFIVAATLAPKHTD